MPRVMIRYLCFLNVVCMTEDLPISTEAIIKITGRQWYWRYEITGAERGYDSMMTDFVDSVDKPLRVNLYDFYQLIVTSSDVIHSFSVPELKIKIDAIPGRINQGVFYTDRLGHYVGYCRELCGAGHAYMPIVVESVMPDCKSLGWAPYVSRK